MSSDRVGGLVAKIRHFSANFGIMHFTFAYRSPHAYWQKRFNLEVVIIFNKSENFIKYETNVPTFSTHTKKGVPYLNTLFCHKGVKLQSGALETKKKGVKGLQPI